MSDGRALVAATSIETGRFAATEVPIDRGDLIRLLGELSEGGQGYVDVRLPGAGFPALCVGFRHGLAVVHCMSHPDSMSLLGGDGSVAGSDSTEVLIMDDLATFTGEYVLKVERAQETLLRFVDGVEVGSLGDWNDL